MNPRIKILIAALMLIGCVGCEKGYWSSKWHLVKGDEAHTKAYQLRTKKVPYEQRMKLYKKACAHFVRAYERDPHLFNLYYIDLAEESCSRVDDEKDKYTFREFREQYTETHPVEAEHGDAGVEIMLSE